MAEQQTPSKRQREETQSPEEETKRHKSYNHILSLLEETEEEEPTQDLSSLITTLQQELSSSDSVVLDDPLPFPTAQEHDHPTTTATASAAAASADDYNSATSSLKEDDKDRVIRHLLEASDDELGIPNRDDGGDGGDEVVVEYEDEGFNNGGNGFAFCDGLWELEDEAANYYTLLQSELFL